jgi:hypothetical protein
MEHACPSCGTSLGESTYFCPNCGAPQLRFEASDEMPGQLPSELTSGQAHTTRGIAWKKALTSAVIIAIPVALLNYVSSLFVVWVVAGGIAVVALYRRRAAGLLLSPRVGFRIGLLMGLLSAFLTVAIAACGMLVERFALHDGASIDTFFQTVLSQTAAQAAQSNPDAATQMADMMRFLNSPDGRAGLVMFLVAIGASSMIAFSAVGGALGARIFAARGRSLRNP